MKTQILKWTLVVVLLGSFLSKDANAQIEQNASPRSGSMVSHTEHPTTPRPSPGMVYIPREYKIDRALRVSDAMDELFENRLVLSIFTGPGFPISDFSSSSGGNNKSGGIDVVLEFEWYFAKQVSIGLALWGGVYGDKDFDKDFGDIPQTNVHTAGGFIKYTLVTGGDWFPYGKFGLGWTVLKFEEPTFTVTTDGGMALMLGTGVLWRVSNLISINGQLAYNHSFVEDAQVKGFSSPVVGFDVQYIAVDAGISFFL